MCSPELFISLVVFCELNIFSNYGPRSLTEDPNVHSGFSFFAHARLLFETVFSRKRLPREDGSYFLRGKAFSAVDRSDLVSPLNLSAAARASKWK